MQTFNVKSLLNTVNNSLLNRVKKSLLNRVENSLLNGVNTIKRLKPLIANTLNPFFQSKSLLSLSSLCVTLQIQYVILLVPRSRSALKESQQGETLHCLLFLILRRYKALKGRRWVYVPKTRESG